MKKQLYKSQIVSTSIYLNLVFFDDFEGLGGEKKVVERLGERNWKEK